MKTTTTQAFFRELVGNPYMADLALNPDLIDQEFPKFEVRFKEDEVKRKMSTMKVFNWLCNLIRWAVDLRFMARTTTQRYTIFLGTDWAQRSDFSKASLVAHELGHMRQWRRWWILYPISYAVVLPALLSFRAAWEWQCFKISIKAYEACGVVYPDSREAMVKAYNRYLVGSPYLFAALLLYPICKRVVRKYIESCDIKYRWGS